MTYDSFVHDFTIIGAFFLALYCLTHAHTILRLVRGPSLAEKARRAERMRRELDRSKMQPRYTPRAEKETRRIWHP